MVMLCDIIDLDLLDQMVEEGYVRYQEQSYSSLRIWNYTEKAQFDKKWNEATINCRGLITKGRGEVVARPWKKFFNYGEGRLKIDDVMPVEVTDKMDGSLGILYWADAGPGIGPYLSIATRGSFMSEQSLHASRLFNFKYSNDINYEVTHDYTFLFEIIYPSNRIVLDYKGMDDLVLLGAVHIERGYYVGPNEAAGYLGWTGPVTQVFPYRNIAEAFAAPDRKNAEGFVVRSGTEIVKIKQVDYIELHRIVTNLTPLSLWRRLAAGATFEQLLEEIPDEWHEWLRKEYETLAEAYQDVEDRVFGAWSEVAGKFSLRAPGNRKQFAQHVANFPDRKYMFMLLDNKPIDQLVWAEIRPKGDDTE